MVTKKNECRFTLRVTPELAARLEVTSAERGIAKNALIVNILWAYFKRCRKIDTA